MKRIAILAAAAATIAAASPAAAVTFAFTQAGGGTIAPGYTLLNDFNGQSGLTGSGFTYYSTNVSGEGAMPMGSDGSTYVAVKSGGTAVATLGRGYRSISLYVGSVDQSNSITFGYGDGTSESLLGSVFAPPANGDQGSAVTNGRFVFDAAPGKAFTSLTFGSGQNSFEFDDLAGSAGAVPEPATWGLMIVGFGLVGAAARRRRMQAAPAIA